MSLTANTVSTAPSAAAVVDTTTVITKRYSGMTVANSIVTTIYTAPTDKLVYIYPIKIFLGSINACFYANISTLLTIPQNADFRGHYVVCNDSTTGVVGYGAGDYLVMQGSYNGGADAAYNYVAGTSNLEFNNNFTSISGSNSFLPRPWLLDPGYSLLHYSGTISGKEHYWDFLLEERTYNA